MEAYIALLRGINVSGQKQIRMSDLKELFAALGAEAVSTYIQSGNVVFRHRTSSIPELIRQIEEKIAEKYGFEVSVLIRTATEIKNILEHNPFAGETGLEPNQPYVTILSGKPIADNIQTIDPILYEPDRFVIREKEIYQCFPNGYGQTKLTNALFEKKLKVTATTRNWKTIQALVTMAELISG